MSDPVLTPPETPTPDLTPTPTTPLPNDPASRTPTGEIKDVAGKLLTPKADEPKKPDEKPPEAKKDEKPAAGAPEKYEDFKVPEGFALTPEVAAKAGELFKGTNLTQDQAQGFIDFHVAEMKRINDSAQTSYDATRKEWRDEVLKDASMAANGELRPEVKATMSKAINSLGPEQAKSFREALDLTGIGDNPAFVKGFAQLAQKFAEGTSVTAKGPSVHGQSRTGSEAKPTAAQALFPALPSSAS